MNALKRIVTGLVFAATIALALTASGGDAYAKVKATDGITVSNSGGITLNLTTPTDEWHVLGVTWE